MSKVNFKYSLLNCKCFPSLAICLWNCKLMLALHDDICLWFYFRFDWKSLELLEVSRTGEVSRVPQSITPHADSLK